MSAAMFHRGMGDGDYRRGPPPMGFRGPPRGMGDHFGPYGPGPMGPPPRDLPPPEPEFVVDREKTCPLLMRVFIKPQGHHRLEDFAVRGKEPKDELQIYTWMDANLRELSDLIKEVHPQARGRATRLSFAFIYPDRRGRNVMRQVGIVHSSRTSEDDFKTLKQLNFQTGDYVSVAIYL